MLFSASRIEKDGTDTWIDFPNVRVGTLDDFIEKVNNSAKELLDTLYNYKF